MVVAALSCPDEKTGKRAYLMACEHNGWHLEDSLRGVICINTQATLNVHDECGQGTTTLEFGVDDFEFAESQTKARIGEGKTDEWFDNFMRSVDFEMVGLTGEIESATSSRLMTKAEVRNILKDELAPIIEHGVEDAIGGIFGNTKGLPPVSIPPSVPNVTNQIQVAVNINGVDPAVLPIPVCLVDQPTPVATVTDVPIVAAIKENTAAFEKYAARFDETFPPPEPEPLKPEILPDFDNDGFFESQEQFASRTGWSESTLKKHREKQNNPVWFQDGTMGKSKVGHFFRLVSHKHNSPYEYFVYHDPEKTRCLHKR